MQLTGLISLEDVKYCVDMYRSLSDEEFMPTPLEVLKTDAKNNLNRLRDEAEVAPLLVGENLFDVDSKSLQRMELTIKASLTVTWTLADNSTVLVTPEMLIEVLSELALRGLQLHNKCKQLKLAVESATTPEEVKSVKWD